MRTDIPAEEYWRAVKPLFDLLDLTAFEVYSSPMLDHDDGVPTLHFRKVVEADAPREDWPIVKQGEGEFAELAYDVRIPLYGGFRAKDLWPDTKYPEGTRATTDAP